MPAKSHGVVITGSTKGVGRALAEEFVKLNDSLVICSRSADTVDATVETLRSRYPSAQVFGCVADVGKHADVERLADFATESLGTVDTFICNAGAMGCRGPLAEADPKDLEAVVNTNLLGVLFCAKETQRVAKSQNSPLHVFIMDGSGSIGNSTAQYAAYGATKRSLPQLISSISIEAKNSMVRFHALSPGMVLTDLLLSGNIAITSKRFFNFLAEEPETVAENLVPRIRSVVDGDKPRTYTKFLDIPKSVYQIVTGFLLGFRNEKFFDTKTGARVGPGRFNENGVRIKE